MFVLCLCYACIIPTMPVLCLFITTVVFYVINKNIKRVPEFFSEQISIGRPSYQLGEPDPLGPQWQCPPVGVICCLLDVLGYLPSKTLINGHFLLISCVILHWKNNKFFTCDGRLVKICGALLKTDLVWQLDQKTLYCVYDIWGSMLLSRGRRLVSPISTELFFH